MDTPETQKHFSKLRTLIQRDSNSRCRQRHNRDHSNTCKCWCKCFLADTFYKKCSKKYPPKTWTINILILFPCNGIPRPQEISPQYPPPRPRLVSSSASTAAFASRSRWTTESWPLLAAKCSGVWPREPRPEAKPWAENPTARKTRRKFGHLKSRSFGNCGHSKILPGLTVRNNVVLRMLWWHRVGWKRPCEPGWQSKCFAETLENVPSLGKQICVPLGHNRIWNQSPTVGISCNRVRGLTHNWTGKT